MGIVCSSCNRGVFLRTSAGSQVHINQLGPHECLEENMLEGKKKKKIDYFSFSGSFLVVNEL